MDKLDKCDPLGAQSQLMLPHGISYAEESGAWSVNVWQKAPAGGPAYLFSHQTTAASTDQKSGQGSQWQPSQVGHLSCQLCA